MEMFNSSLLLLLSLLHVAAAAEDGKTEIDIFEAMDINAQTVGLQKVQGLEGESGDAYKIEENISRNELPSSYLEQIRFLLNNKRRMVIMANVKMMHHSRGTLFSLERRKKGQVLLSVWVTCYRTCRLGITYQTSQLKPQDVTFHRVGKMSDGRWHKIALYMFPQSHLGKTAVELFVDCKMLGRKKMMRRIENLVLPSKDVVFLFAQRGVEKEGAMLTWKGSLQNFKLLFHESIEELMNSTNCSWPSSNVLVDYEDEQQFEAANLLTSRSQISRGEFIGSPAGHAVLPALHYSIQDVMMVLVTMQKEAQRREESFQRSLMKLKEKLQSQSLDVDSIKETLENGVCSDRAYSPGTANGNNGFLKINTKMENIDVVQKENKCSLKPCFPFVDCKETPGEGLEFKCGECPPGYSGDGIRCNDVNECLYHPCSPHTTCTNLQPGYECTACPKGFVGNSTIGIGRVFAENIKQICKDIDECNNGKNGGCSVHSTCINTPGSYSCDPCHKGYVGDPYKECVRIRYCSGDPNTNPCGEGAECIPIKEGAYYKCRCKPGLAGNGFLCETDADMDGLPDKAMNCSDPRCLKDNCKNFPNADQKDNDDNGDGDACDYDSDGDRYPDYWDNCPGVSNRRQTDKDRDRVGDACDNCPKSTNRDQKDVDGDGVGDACDDDADGDGLRNVFDNCPLVPNRKQRNSDGDNVGDACDNCPATNNPDQNDKDKDGWGDACDMDRDFDNDGIEDKFDNCLSQPNLDQMDTDLDGKGDVCDSDDDEDGVVDFRDNCRLVFNVDQKQTKSDLHGDACVDDYDGDGISDQEDMCPTDPRKSRLDFTGYTTLILDAEGSEQDKPFWKVNKKGDEIQQVVNSVATIFTGNQVFRDVEYSGTFFVNTRSDDDIIGIVFGYQSPRKFFVASWKQSKQVYWDSRPFRAKAEAALNIKKIHSVSGPSRTLRNVLWHTGNTTNEATLLWIDPKKRGWQDLTAYRWQLIYLPSRHSMRLKIWLKYNKLMMDTGEIKDPDVGAGKLGLMSFSQERVIWSAVSAHCLDPFH